MTRTMLFALAATTTVAGGMSMFFGQGTPVNLQPTTPGTQQVGNANVSGRIIAGSVQAESSNPTAQVIVGNATSMSGANFGGFFRSDSPLGRALYGRASALSGTTHGVWGQADSPGGRGVTGVAAAANGNATGVWGQTGSTTGRGVYGLTTSGSGVNYGVMGQSSSPAGFGVYSVGKMHATGVISGNGSGLTNVNAATLGGFQSSSFLQAVPNPLNLMGSQGNAHIVMGQNTSTANGSAGVLGIVSSATGYHYGVVGRNSSTQGTGVFGWAEAQTGNTKGVYGYSPSPDGTGVFGHVPAASGQTTGIWGQSASPSGRGVVGYADATSGFTYGVFGSASSASGWGMYSLGNFGASGTKAFRIDHPSDPDNKYLLHYAAESPMPQNFYVGNVVTDAQGYAWVDLPDYFSEINVNFKYQLTVVGKTFAQAVVWEKVKGDRFQIRTNEPNIEVSWRVDADRNDLYVRNRPPKDVVEKEGRERGTYQHPEFYGFGPERGMDYRGERKLQDPPATTRRR